MDYKFSGIDVAMQILRPNATFEISGLEITRWDDPRPQPSIEEIQNMMDSIKKFEDKQVIEIIEDDKIIAEVNIQDFVSAMIPNDK
jgi:hypothetical protein